MQIKIITQEHELKEEQQGKAQEKQLNELKKLNEARFSLFQANLDKERLNNHTQHPVSNLNSGKHWIKQLENFLVINKDKKIDFTQVPKDLSCEIISYRHLKTLYKQLRSQFEEKNKVLETTRAQYYQLENSITSVAKRGGSSKRYFIYI